MQRGHGPTVDAERSGRACVFAAPDPCTVAEGQVLRADISLGIEEVRAVLLGLRVVTDELDAPDVRIPDPTVRGVYDEEAAWHPFVDIACADLESGRSVGRDGLSHLDPLPDE